MESKTVKYLKSVSELNICKTNATLRLHYRSECDSVSKSAELLVGNKSTNAECKFCYSTLPTIKVLTRLSGSKKRSKVDHKKFVTFCRVCKKKYPEALSAKLQIRKKSTSIKGVEPANTIDSENKHDKPKRKKKSKDENAGLILPPKVVPIVQAPNKTEKRHGDAFKGNQKLLQMLSKSEKHPKMNNKLEMLFD